MNLPEKAPAWPRHRSWPAVLLLLLALVLALQIVFDRRRLADAAQAVAAGPAAAGSAGSASSAAAASAAASAPEPQWGQAGEAAARVARAASAALATARAAAGLSPAAPTEQLVELCGVGRLTLPAAAAGEDPAEPGLAWRRLPPSLGDLALRQAGARVLAELSAPGRPERARAAAWLLRSAGASDTASVAPAVAAASAPAAAALATRNLARLARNSRDPTVLQWALAACSRETRASAECRRVSPRDWARLAPDDGLAWLAQAGMPGGTPATRSRALQNAAQAERFGGPSAALAQAVDAAWPEDLPGYLRLHGLRTVLAIETALLRPTWDGALALCSADALAVPGRRERCEGLARRIRATGHEQAALQTAAALAERLGWPDSEREALKQEEAALVQAAASLVPADQPFACSVLEDTRAWLGAVAGDGEVQAARRRLAMNPTTARPAASRP